VAAILVREEGVLLAVADEDPSPVRHAAERAGGAARLTAIHRLRPAHPAVSGRSAPASPEACPGPGTGERPEGDRCD